MFVLVESTKDFEAKKMGNVWIVSCWIPTQVLTEGGTKLDRANDHQCQNPVVSTDGGGGQATVTVRAAVEEDVDALVGLLEGGSLVPRSATRDMTGYRRAIAEIADTPGSELLVAQVGGEVVGMCQLITFRHFQEGGGRCRGAGVRCTCGLTCAGVA